MNKITRTTSVAGLIALGLALAACGFAAALADGWVPEHGQPVEGRIRLKASLDAKEKAGEYSAVFGMDKTRSGGVSVRPIAPGEMKAALAVLSRPVNAATPWRVHCMSGPALRREKGNVTVGGRGNFTRWALDFWQMGADNARSQRNALPRPGDGRVVAGIPSCVTVPGPAGALPTVRYLMIREALQETEARIVIKQALHKACPEAFSPKRKPEERSETENACLAVLRDYEHRSQTARHVSQSDLSLDWFRSVAQTYILAGEMTGARTPVAWDQPSR